MQVDSGGALVVLRPSEGLAGKQGQGRDGTDDQGCRASPQAARALQQSLR